MEILNMSHQIIWLSQLESERDETKSELHWKNCFQQKAERWISNYCHVICDIDGEKHECQIVKQNETNTNILPVVIGRETEEVKNSNILKESMGELERPKL